MWDSLEPLRFITGKNKDTWLEISPEGYTYDMNIFGSSGSKCFIGIQKVENLQFIRLGTVFLRNFYIGLDYEKDMIMIGVNAG